MRIIRGTPYDLYVAVDLSGNPCMGEGQEKNWLWQVHYLVDPYTGEEGWIVWHYDATGESSEMRLPKNWVFV